MALSKEEDFPVDIVYLWCNSADKNWQKKKETELLKCGKTLDKDAVSDCRFINSNELKYSLRSLEKYAGWIRNIFIVTDFQIPEWLNTENPKIHIVNHSQILPKGALPTFNASAIETAIHKIPNLSEHFLFANDDMFLGAPVDKNFFFNEDGSPIFRFSKRRILNKKYRHLYGYMVAKAYRLVQGRVGKSFPYFPHHNIDAYRKSDIEKCYNDFREDFDLTAYQKFRQKECIQRSIFAYYAISNNNGTYKIVNNFSAKFDSYIKGEPIDSVLIELQKSKIVKLVNSNTKLFCMNDSVKTTEQDRNAMIDFLETKFPVVSSFEKAPEKNTEIFICYHKKFNNMGSDILKPIQVGSALSNEDFGFIKDNSGDNISAKNKYYSELTALYWIWKNSTADCVGLMHYRRLFDLSVENSKRWFNSFDGEIDNKLMLNNERVNCILSDYDIVVPMKRIIPKVKSSYEYYKKKHIVSDLDKVLEIIKSKTPDIYDTAEKVLKNSKSIYLYNMFISSKDFLNGYASWLFDILSVLEEGIQADVEQRTPYQQRVYGFLSERLFTVYVEYLKKSGLKVKEVPVVYCETKKSRYRIFQIRTFIYRLFTKFGIRKPHWNEQYGV